MDGLYKSNTGILTKYVNNYNFIARNSKTIYPISGSTKIQANNTFYICDNCILFLINNKYETITYD